MTDPTQLKTMSLSLNYDPEILKELEIDPRTSEGKAKIKELILAALDFYRESIEHEPHPESPEDLALIEALTGGSG